MAQPFSFTIEALNQQIRANVVGALHESFKSSLRQVVVRGTIGEIPPTQYRICYKVPVRDGNHVVYLDIERDLISRSKIERGDYVEVIGNLSVDDGQSQSSRVDIRIAVSGVAQVERPKEFEREERATLEYLRRLRPSFAQLPPLGDMVISIIHPVSERAQVHEDFKKQLSEAKYPVRLEPIPVAMNRADDIASGIQRASGNVIVLIRGGGDQADFDVFDRKGVIEAWAGKNAFKALGLGHAGTRGALLDFISDYVGTTPTAVGSFLARQIIDVDQRNNELAALRHRCESLAEEKRTLNSELSQANDAGMREVQRIMDVANRQRDRWVMATAFLLPIMFLLGVWVGHRLTL